MNIDSPAEETRIIYGRHPVSEAMKANFRGVEKVYFQQGMDREGRKVLESVRRHGIWHRPAAKDRLFQLCGSKHHQGLVAEAKRLTCDGLSHLNSNKDTGLRVLLLPSVQDPGNLGAVIRNCEHFALDLLALGEKGSCDPQLGSVAKSSAGAVEHQSLEVTDSPADLIHRLKSLNFKIFALEQDSPDGLIHQTPAKDDNICLVLGSEGFGLQQSLVRRMDGTFSIPRLGKVNSLNLSSASMAAILWMKGFLGGGA
jgi:23S rRNA (guanosine2251-2'-O)-methyltransferase